MNSEHHCEIEVSDKQQRIKELAEDTRTRMKRSALDICHIGANLREAQELLPHGEFLPWIEAEFGMGKSSAYRFMDVARTFQGKLPNLGNLEIAASALYQLAAANTPKKAREKVLELAATGEHVTNAKAAEVIEKHTSVEQEVRHVGESLGLPMRGNSVLPESNRVDELTHISPFDVNDRPGSVLPGAIATSDSINSTEVLAGNTPVLYDEPPPTFAQMVEVRSKIAELLEALKEAQGKIEQLRSERDELKEKVEWLTTEVELLRQRTNAAPSLSFKEDAFSTRTRLEPLPLVELELAKRLGVKEKTLLRLQNEPNFQDWTRQYDPDGFAWGYFSEEEPPYRVLEQDTAEGTEPVRVEQDENASDSEGILELTEKSATVVALSEVAIASKSVGILEPATAPNEPVEEAIPDSRENLEPLTSLGLAARLDVDNSNIGRNMKKGDEHFRKWSAERDPSDIAWEYRPGKNRSPQYHPLI